MLLDPSETRNLVVQTEVACFVRFGVLPDRKSEDAQPVVDRDEDEGLALILSAVVRFRP